MNWRRKCWEKCGGSGTDAGRKRRGREERGGRGYPFTRLKLSCQRRRRKTVSSNIAQKREGRKKGKTKRSLHRRRQRSCSNRNMLMICWSFGQHPYRMSTGSWDKDVDPDMAYALYNLSLVPVTIYCLVAGRLAVACHPSQSQNT